MVLLVKQTEVNGVPQGIPGEVFQDDLKELCDLSGTINTVDEYTV